MKARVTIIGNLTKDAENIVTKSGKEQCKFSIAVNLTKEKGFFVDCFFNMPLAKDQLQHFKKGTLATFVGRYSENLNKDGGIVYLNRMNVDQRDNEQCNIRIGHWSSARWLTFVY